MRDFYCEGFREESRAIARKEGVAALARALCLLSF